MAAFRRILVASDLDGPSDRALEVAAEMARDSGADLVVVHVCEIPTYAYAGTSGALMDLLSPFADLAQEKIDALLAALHDRVPGARAILKMGIPWEQILATISEVGADLVVMGTHGRRGTAHVLLGSVAEKIVRMSPVPVLTVRPLGRPATSACS